MVLAPEHPLVEKVTSDEQQEAVNRISGGRHPENRDPARLCG